MATVTGYVCNCKVLYQKWKSAGLWRWTWIYHKGDFWMNAILSLLGCWNILLQRQRPNRVRRIKAVHWFHVANAFPSLSCNCGERWRPLPPPLAPFTFRCGRSFHHFGCFQARPFMPAFPVVYYNWHCAKTVVFGPTHIVYTAHDKPIQYTPEWIMNEPTIGSGLINLFTTKERSCTDRVGRYVLSIPHCCIIRQVLHRPEKDCTMLVASY